MDILNHKKSTLITRLGLCVCSSSPLFTSEPHIVVCGDIDRLRVEANEHVSLKFVGTFENLAWF